MGQDSSSKHSTEDSRAPRTLTILSSIRWETPKHWDMLINTGPEMDKKAHSQELTGWHTTCAASSLLKAADLLHGPGVLASGSSRTCPGLLSVVLLHTWKTTATTHLLSLGNWYGVFTLVLKSEPVSCVLCHQVPASCLFSSQYPGPLFSKFSSGKLHFTCILWPLGRISTVSFSPHPLTNFSNAHVVTHLCGLSDAEKR